MDIAERVDRLIYKKEEPVNDSHRLKRWHWFLLFVVMASLGSVVAFDFFQRKEGGFDTQQFLVDELNKNKQDLGSHPAYSYWYPPNNSFGVGEHIIWNMTWVKNKVKNNVDSMLETNTGGGWFDNSEKLDVGLRWNKTGFFKVWFNVTDLEYGNHRVTFYSNIENLSSMINKTDDEIWIYYPVGNETLTLCFNYSDLKGLGLTFRSGKHNGNWYFRFRRDGFQGNYSFDPQFGHTGTGTGSQGFIGDIWGSIASPASDGITDNITAYLKFDGLALARCALYNNATKRLVGVSEERNIDTGNVFAWVVFNITEAVNTSWNYYICVWSSVDSLRFQSGGYYFREKTTYNGTFRNVIINEGSGASMVCIYASYTESGGEPSAAWNQVFTNNFSYSNTTDYQQTFTNNFSYSNTTLDVQVFTNNFSYSNSSIVRVWQQVFINTFSYSNSSPEVVTVYPGVYFDIESDTERYHVNQTMNFSRIIINESWIMFNDTDFNITSGNFINISLTYIDNDTINQTTNNAFVVGFWANTTTGTVYYNISGFNSSDTYYVNLNGSHLSNLNSDGNGCINYSHSLNGSRLYEIYKGTVTARNWQQVFTNNFSYSNTTTDRQIFTNNFSYSNTTTDRQIFTNNFSYSNTTVDTQVFTNNFSYSNTSEIWTQVFTNNFSYSNTSRAWQQVFTNNFSYSNSSVPIAWYQEFTNNFSYSNSTPPLFNVTLIYPTNNSNIYAPQPTLRFNISHPSGNLMNWSIYVGENYNYLLASGTNATNGTYVHVNYDNVTEFYTDYNYSVNVSDGADWINVSCTFQAVLQGGGSSRSDGIAVIGLLGFLAFPIALYFGFKRRKR